MGLALNRGKNCSFHVLVQPSILIYCVIKVQILGERGWIANFMLTCVVII